MLTGQRDTDLLILDKLDDKDLLNVCLVNKEARKLCSYEPFWINRFIKQRPFFIFPLLRNNQNIFI